MLCRLQSACIHRVTSATPVLRQLTILRISTWREHWSSKPTIPIGQKKWGSFWVSDANKHYSLINLSHKQFAMIHSEFVMYVKKYSAFASSGESSAFRRVKSTQERNWCWWPSTYNTHALCLRSGAGCVWQLNDRLQNMNLIGQNTRSFIVMYHYFFYCKLESIFGLFLIPFFYVLCMLCVCSYVLLRMWWLASVWVYHTSFHCYCESGLQVSTDHHRLQHWDRGLLM